MRDFLHNSSFRGAGELPSSWHSEFEELCALAPSGELTEEEWSRLREHLEYCDLCRQAVGEYQRVATEIMPAIAPELNLSEGKEQPAKPFDVESGKQRLFDALEQKPNQTSEVKKKNRIDPKMLLLALAVALSGFGTARYLHNSRQSESPSNAQPTPVIAATSRPIPFLAPKRIQENRRSQEREKLSELLERLKQESSSNQNLRAQIDALKQGLQSQEQEKGTLEAKSEELEHRLTQIQAEEANLREQATASVGAQTQIAGLQREVQSLRSALREKDQSLTENAELLSHDRDIRDLIGARNLLIAEIYDIGQTGARNKPFGRIFYTKDKSLIFYGYDLDRQSGLKRAVDFQAWGSSGNGKDINLGLFYQDNTQKRWVLKFNDAKALAHLNSVFVTMEPKGGSERPSGKPLLMASLRIEANHP